MNDHTPFLAAILEAPEEEVNYCVYADWLGDIGEEKLSHVLLAMVACRRAREMVINSILPDLRQRQFDEAQAELQRAIIATDGTPYPAIDVTNNNWGNWCGWMPERWGWALWVRSSDGPQYLSPDGKWLSEKTYISWSSRWSRGGTTSASSTAT